MICPNHDSLGDWSSNQKKGGGGGGGKFPLLGLMHRANSLCHGIFFFKKFRIFIDS